MHLRIHRESTYLVLSGRIRLRGKVVRGQEGFELGYVVLDDRYHSAGGYIELSWWDERG
jgi:hypothetical protein